MLDQSKRYGIWGFGIIGKSVASLLVKHGISFVVMDRKEPSDDNRRWLSERSIDFFTENQIDDFFNVCDFVIPSAGVDIRNRYQKYRQKWISEVDLFSAYWRKPIIAITGTVGKTTTTSLLSQLLNGTGFPVATGGNIGIGMCDLLDQQESVGAALLEISDVQLKYSKQFAPSLAIWTNFFENHLDWHDNLDDYFQAKTMMLRHQTASDAALINSALLPKLNAIAPALRATIHLFDAHQEPSAAIKTTLDDRQQFFFIRDGIISSYSNGSYKDLINVSDLPSLTYQENWLAIIGALELLKIESAAVKKRLPTLTAPSYRLEKTAGPWGIDFYNDAKSTTAASTIAAVNALDDTRAIRLFLGGLDKGVDRSILLPALAKKSAITVYAFGAQAEWFFQRCAEIGIRVHKSDSLEPAFTRCMNDARPNDQILFSPSGSSFDLFANYQERGAAFAKLVAAWINQHERNR